MSVFPIHYLRLASPVLSYVVAVDGLPEEAHNMDNQRAEDLAAWSGHIVRTAVERLGVKPPTTVVLESGDADYVIRDVEGHTLTIVVKPGYGPAIARAISGRGPRCRVCDTDLSLALVECPHCGALNPFAAEACSECGRPIRERKCPRCGARIDPTGHPIGLREKLLSRAARTRLITPDEER